MAGDLTSGDTDERGYSHDNLRHVVITATCFALIISTIAVILRLACRRITKTKLFLDDYLMIAALVFEYGISFAGVVLLHNGLGTHIHLVPPNQLVVYMKTLSSGSFLYPACITCVKLSLLAFYKRLFPIKPMVLAVNIVGAMVVLWCFGACLIGAVTCIPFRKLWDPTIPGGCIDLAKFYYGLQIPNIVTDAVILVMPLRVVWDLQMKRVQKVLLTGIFMLGFLTLIFDIIRLVALIELSEAGPDITYNQVNASVWTCIEPCVGITAACLSNMRPLFNLLPDVPWRKFSFRSITSGRHSSDAGKTRSMEEGKANNERKKDDHSTTVLELSGQDSGLGGSTLGGSMGSSSRSVRGES
ncbi:hypothetical protein ASPSYDRAFT_41316 [Aspergillus sydowii CBS 593.65]|uniref:Rhodopsin domain-containing protein n=1 Tax=Aspergillus sydowii CBS 593.65 TaxID=1036612 RepID=A0A1L9TT81_9EURO|nr:uncharacterized protein ASPSYDRAFT_41316 [Aspergillus sydowii CBS 593.65]OJJ62647.1 hypothetical protein ASPSYDRAFT_41316 [Aspergillus sydowii CBS 593.65]